MTDRERAALLHRARRHLRQTKRGYNETGSEWKAANKLLDELAADLNPPPTNAPNLGAVYAAGQSILFEDCTHITSGLGWPAFDTAFGRVGEPVLAPEALVITDDTSSAQGGNAFYAKGVSGLQYWFGHITTVPKQGTKFRKGQKLTTVSGDHPRPHLHLGIDARQLLGHHLVSHDDYTHGAPKIGVQLRGAK